MRPLPLLPLFLATALAAAEPVTPPAAETPAPVPAAETPATPDATGPAPAKKDPKVVTAERRLDTATKALEKVTAQRDAVQAAVTEAQGKMATLTELLAKLELLQARARDEVNDRGNVTDATQKAIDEVAGQSEPMQRQRRHWVKTIADAKATMPTLEQRVVDAQRNVDRYTRELEKARNDAAPLLGP